MWAASVVAGSRWVVETSGMSEINQRRSDGSVGSDRRREIFCFPLETESGFANSLVATLEVASGAPSGAAEFKTGTGACPGASHTHLALWRIWLCALMTSPPCFDRPSVSIAYSTSSRRPHRGTDESYPPYNIERLAEDRYQITPLAVAGFSLRRNFDHGGRAERRHHRRRQNRKDRARVPLQEVSRPRHFKRQFEPGRLCSGKRRVVRKRLADDRDGRGEIPEAMKPRRIAINGAVAFPTTIPQLEG